MFELDELAYRSACLKWSPTGKFVFVLTLLISSLLAKSLLVPLTVVIVGTVLLGYSIRFKFPRIIGLILVNSFGMLILSGIVIAAITPGNVVLSLNLVLFQISFSDAGIFTASFVTLRALERDALLRHFHPHTILRGHADEVENAEGIHRPYDHGVQTFLPHLR